MGPIVRFPLGRASRQGEPPQALLSPAPSAPFPAPHGEGAAGASRDRHAMGLGCGILMLLIPFPCSLPPSAPSTSQPGQTAGWRGEGVPRASQAPAAPPGASPGCGHRSGVGTGPGRVSQWLGADLQPCSALALRSCSPSAGCSCLELPSLFVGLQLLATSTSFWIWGCWSGKQVMGRHSWCPGPWRMRMRRDGHGKQALAHCAGLIRGQDIRFPLPMFRGSFLAAPPRSCTGWEVRPGMALVARPRWRAEGKIQPWRCWRGWGATVAQGRKGGVGVAGEMSLLPVAVPMRW